MKYHATITNEDGATVSKGGNDRLTMTLKEGNKIVGTIVLDAQGIRHDIMPKDKWSECNHYVTHDNGLCVRCGYNTRGLTNKELGYCHVQDCSGIVREGDYCQRHREEFADKLWDKMK